MRCPSFGEITSFYLKELRPEDDMRIARHIEWGCKACRAQLEWLENLRSAQELSRPPDWAVRSVCLWGASLGAQKQRRFGLRKRLLAYLVFDSLTQPQPIQVRNLAEAGRRLLYKAGSLNIDLHIMQTEDLKLKDILGQVVPERGDFGGIKGARIELFGGRRRKYLTWADEVGMFSIPSLNAGVYKLKIKLEDSEVTISSLPVA